MRYDPHTSACTEFRTGTHGTNGLMFDAQGRLYGCQSGQHCITRFEPDGNMTPLPNRLDGHRHNRPNDLAIDRKGRIWFTDPFGRGRPAEERELDHASILWLDPQPGGNWTLQRMTFDTTSPNGILFSQDERTLYVANTRSSQYIHAIRLDAAGHMVGRSIFADLNESTGPGIPDGLKVDSIGRVYCTGPGGIWVIDPNGTRIGVIRWPEQAVNFAFGGPDLRTLFCCAHTSVYTLRVKVPGNPHPWYKLRGRTT